MYLPSFCAYMYGVLKAILVIGQQYKQYPESGKTHSHTGYGCAGASSVAYGLIAREVERYVLQSDC